MAETTSGVRVRMAPGPTGPFHIGRTRTALLNWLFAKHHGGTFVLRIEDTDVERSKPEHLQGILDSLRWLGLQWDEGPDVGGPHEPYFQMGRLDTYRDAAKRLLAIGDAYPCYCSQEDLEALRARASQEGRPYRYPGTCRNLSAEERQQREAQGIEPVYRLKMPAEGATRFDDMLLGPITVRNTEVDDWVIMRSNWIPTYNFAVVIDDVTMEITHVIRGQEHISNTIRQIHVYQALGKPMPVFGHLPMVLDMDRSKLSARKGAHPVTEYETEGYLPEAIVNYLGTIGASYDGEREIFSVPELIEVFDIHKLGKAGAAFSDEKLEWMNAVHIRALPLDEFVKRSLPFLQLRGLISSQPSDEEIAYAAAALALEQERVRTLAETPDAVEFFLSDQVDYDPALLIVKKSSLEDARRVLDASLEEIDRVASFEHDVLEAAFRALTARLGLKTGVVFGTIRVAITGRTAAPPLFDTMHVLGKERVRERLAKARHQLDAWHDSEPANSAVTAG
jgi:glutamyl-tRNA synthetase